MTELVPPEILAVLRERIASLETLETLLLLHRVPERAWTASEVARLLALPHGICRATLAKLDAHGFAVEVAPNLRAAWAYAPESAALAELVDRLAELYADRQPDILRCLSAQ